MMCKWLGTIPATRRTFTKGALMRILENEVWEEAHTNRHIDNRLPEHVQSGQAAFLLLIALVFGLCAIEQQRYTAYPHFAMVGVIIALVCGAWAAKLLNAAYTLSQHRATILEQHRVAELRLISPTDISLKLIELRRDLCLRDLAYKALCEELQGKSDPKSYTDRSISQRDIDDACDRHREYVEALRALNYRIALSVNTFKGHEFY